jgi:hypothetical protein
MELIGFELCQRILEIDLNIRVCFVIAVEINEYVIRELYSNKGWFVLLKSQSQ